MKSSLFTLLLVLVFALPSSAQMKNPCNPCSKKGVVFHINDKMGRNTVTFKSEAPLEDIIGTSNQIKGYIAFDPQHAEKGGHGEFAVAVASLNSGIPLRDEHIQSANWLDASKYPNITFKIKDTKGLKKVKSSAGSATYEVSIVGDLSFHGKTKQVVVPGRITYLKESEKTRTKLPGDLLAVRASFNVNLSDFGVTGPTGADLIGSKVGDTIELAVSLVGSTAAAAMAGNPCNPCGGKAKNPCNPCGDKAKNPCNPCGGKAKKS